MLHTPPTKDDWSSIPSIQDSYDNKSSDSIDNVSNVKSNDTNSIDPSHEESKITQIITDEAGSDGASSNSNDHIHTHQHTEFPKSPALDQNDDIQEVIDEELPEPLYNLIEEFFVYLKQPRFNKPLATFEIAELFQKLYVKFNNRNVEYVKRIELRGAQRHARRRSSASSSSNISLNPTILEDEEQHKERERVESALIQKYNAIAEEIVCEKFYSSIVYPNKGIKSDELELGLDRDFNFKLSLLNVLGIGFENLDLELPIDEEFFCCKIEEVILPEFEIMATERSPTKKLKILLLIHKLCNKLITEMTEGSIGELNTDIYLPLLIYIIVKLEHIHTHGLTLQLHFIKRFRNYIIYDTDTQESDDEKGQLLYVLTNFEAAIMYLSSVNLENLHIELPVDAIPSYFPNFAQSPSEIIQSLTVPLNMDAVPELQIKNIHNAYKNRKRYRTNATSANAPFALLSSAAADFSLYHANQGLRTLSSTVDTSLRTIFGRVSSSSWMSSSGIDNHNNNHESSSSTLEHNDSGNQSSISEETLRQITENLAIQEGLGIQKKSTDENTTTASNNNASEEDQQRQITPMSTNSTTSTIQSGGGHTIISSSSDNSNPGDKTYIESANGNTMTSSPSQERLLTKMASSMGGVMKNFRPLSSSSSSDSIHKQLQSTLSSSNLSNMDSNNSNNGPQSRIRSRATSLINSGLFGSTSNSSNTNGSSMHQTSSRNSFFSSIENAIDSVVNDGTHKSQQHPGLNKTHSSSQSIDTNITVNSFPASTKKILDEVKAFPKFEEKQFNDLTITELKEVFERYQYIVNNI